MIDKKSEIIMTIAEETKEVVEETIITTKGIEMETTNLEVEGAEGVEVEVTETTNKEKMWR